MLSASLAISKDFCKYLIVLIFFLDYRPFLFYLVKVHVVTFLFFTLFSYLSIYLEISKQMKVKDINLTFLNGLKSTSFSRLKLTSE